MKYAILNLFFGASLALHAQGSNLIFFTEKGENFTLFVNGDRINKAPNTRAKATGITADFAQIKIEFETPGAPVVKSNLMIDQEKEMTAVIRKNKKGKYIIRMVSSVDIPQTSEKSEEVTIVQAPVQTSYETTTVTQTSHKDSETETLLDVKVTKDRGFSMKVNQEKWEEEPISSSSKTTTATQQLSAVVDKNNIILSDGRVYTFKYVKMNNFGARLEMKAPVGAQATISYDKVEAYTGEVPFLYDEKDWKKGNAYFKLRVIEPSGEWAVKLKYSNGNKMIIESSSVNINYTTQAVNTGCHTAMSSNSYNRAVESINNKSFADEKMTVFRQIVKVNCLDVEQVIGFMDAFTYEEEKIEVAKLAYDRTIDLSNYYRVNDALTYSESVEELQVFLQKQ